ncbi:surface antigen BspA-like [Trichomonas vaginalis G3]|uniref:Surface antigen BspA-like n=1 Tax=Trichomonas vaginalis (strain ATCC PRA-98 / G3) TaxID=412133 RepID=A2DYW1_TRIV3|nr:surface antigen BspA-like [Trichomonas vaginalis G3]|eukprot:XP_001326595.1 surface antigen BspA-like [Trichomonas vaginalis G3]
MILSCSPLTIIGISAFYGCTSLTSVTISGNLIYIGFNAFYKCPLTEIINLRNVSYIGEDVFRYSKLTNIIISGTDLCIEKYSFNECKSLINVTILGSISSIGNYSFYHCWNLTSITIPDGLTYIGDHAFDNCRSLTNIAVTGHDSYIGNYAFCECSSLTSIIISGSKTQIGLNAFDGCTSLTSVAVSANVTYCRGYITFSGSSNIYNITLLHSIYDWNHIVLLDRCKNIFVPRTFIATGESHIQYGTHLYVTSRTILTNSSKAFFGEKHVYVHYNNKKGIYDKTTIDVLEYISIENISIPLLLPETANDFLLYKSHHIHLSFVIISLNSQPVS